MGVFLVAIAIAAAGALAFRLPALDLRPMHGDPARGEAEDHGDGGVRGVGNWVDQIA